MEQVYLYVIFDNEGVWSFLQGFYPLLLDSKETCLERAREALTLFQQRSPLPFEVGCEVVQEGEDIFSQLDSKYNKTPTL